MIRRIKVACLAAALSLVGCTMIPHYQQPALPVPDQFPGLASTAAGSAPVAAATSQPTTRSSATNGSTGWWIWRWRTIGICALRC